MRCATAMRRTSKFNQASAFQIQDHSCTASDQGRYRQALHMIAGICGETCTSRNMWMGKKDYPKIAKCPDLPGSAYPPKVKDMARGDGAPGQFGGRRPVHPGGVAQGPWCPEGHPMVVGLLPAPGPCDECDGWLKGGEEVMLCRLCAQVLCGNCIQWLEAPDGGKRQASARKSGRWSQASSTPMASSYWSTRAERWRR